MLKSQWWMQSDSSSSSSSSNKWLCLDHLPAFKSVSRQWRAVGEKWKTLSLGGNHYFMLTDWHVMFSCLRVIWAEAGGTDEKSPSGGERVSQDGSMFPCVRKASASRFRPPRELQLIRNLGVIYDSTIVCNQALEISEEQFKTLVFGWHLKDLF